MKGMNAKIEELQIDYETICIENKASILNPLTPTVAIWVQL